MVDDMGVNMLKDKHMKHKIMISNWKIKFLISNILETDPAIYLLTR